MFRTDGGSQNILHLDLSHSQRFPQQHLYFRTSLSLCTGASFLSTSKSDFFATVFENAEEDKNKTQLCALLLAREVSVPAPPAPQSFPLHLFFFLSLCLSHSYESSAEILPHTPRLTHFPTVSGSPASLADSMQQKLAGPRRRRPQNPSAM